MPSKPETDRDDGDDIPADEDEGFEHLDEDHPSRGKSYLTGKNKPPVQSRFQKGVSGNPRGKKKGAHVATQLRSVFLKPIAIKKADGKEVVPTIVAAAMLLVQKALAGDLKATDQAMRLARDVGMMEAAPVDAISDEQMIAVLDDFVKRAKESSDDS